MKEFLLPPTPGCYDLSGAIWGKENDLARCGPIEENLKPEPIALGSQINSAPGPLPGAELSKELSLDEERDLAECEGEIHQCLAELSATGARLWLRLARIRDGRLYRKHCRTFEEYCETRWHFSARRARQLCQAAETVKAMGWNDQAAGEGDGDRTGTFALPASEKHIRPLYDLPIEHRRAAWAKAWLTRPQRGMTGAHVKKVVAEERVRLGLQEGTKGQEGLTGARPSRAPEPESQNQPARLAEPKVKEMADTVIRSVRLLRDCIGTPDSANAANVTVALDLLEAYRDHLSRCERMQERRPA